MKIVWSDPAVSDLDSIWDFIARDSPHYATQTVQRLIDAVEPLATFPAMGRHVPEAESDDMRELIVGGYRVIYRVMGQQVEIATVVHGSRDLAGEPKPWMRNE